MRHLTPDQLDSRTDSGKSLYAWLGRKVRLHFGPVGVLVRHRTRKYAVRFTFGRCRKCRRQSPVLFAVSGLHNGAWCYLYTQTGRYLANMRDDDYRCDCEAETPEEMPLSDADIKRLQASPHKGPREPVKADETL